MMELEGREVVVEARVECEPPPDTRCHITCRPYQVHPRVLGTGCRLAAGRRLSSLAAPCSSQLTL